MLRRLTCVKDNEDNVHESLNINNVHKNITFNIKRISMYCLLFNVNPTGKSDSSIKHNNFIWTKIYLLYRKATGVHSLNNAQLASSAHIQNVRSDSIQKLPKHWWLNESPLFSSVMFLGEKNDNSMKTRRTLKEDELCSTIYLVHRAYVYHRANYDQIAQVYKLHNFQASARYIS